MSACGTACSRQRWASPACARSTTSRLSRSTVAWSSHCTSSFRVTSRSSMPTTSPSSSSARSARPCPRWMLSRLIFEPLLEPQLAKEVVSDAESVERIVREVAGAPPRSLRFLRTDEGIVAFLTLGLDPQSRLVDAHAPRHRDQGAHPGGAPGDRRRDRSHRAMKLCMFSPKGEDLPRGWPGRIDGDHVVQLAAQTLQAFFTGGGRICAGARGLSTRRGRPPAAGHPSADRAPLHGRVARLRVSEYRFDLRPGGRDPISGGCEQRSNPQFGLAAVIGAEDGIGGYTLANIFVAARAPCVLEQSSEISPSRSVQL